jgi:hypothetical protein
MRERQLDLLSLKSFSTIGRLSFRRAPEDGSMKSLDRRDPSFHNGMEFDHKLGEMSLIGSAWAKEPNEKPIVYVHYCVKCICQLDSK